MRIKQAMGRNRCAANAGDLPVRCGGIRPLPVCGPREWRCQSRWKADWSSWGMRASRTLVARFIVTVFLAGLIALPCLAGEQEMLTLMRRITGLAQEGRYGEAITLARKLANEAERTSG